MQGYLVACVDMLIQSVVVDIACEFTEGKKLITNAAKNLSVP